MRILLLTIILSTIVYAQLPEENITPPLLPTGDEVAFSLRLYHNNTLITNSHARLALTDEQNERFDTLKYIPEDGNLTVQLIPGKYYMQILIDDLATPGKDYTYATEIRITKPTTDAIILFPVGSVRGTVYVDNQAVPFTSVLLYCTGMDKVVELTTDASGSFVADWLPIGECRITAATEANRGEATIAITKGGLPAATISLTERIMPRINWMAVIGALLVVAIFFILFRKKHKQAPAIEREQDIFTTLNNKEQAVVKFLRANNNKSTQATIKNETGIPKTSLIRIFQSLEAKKIITVEKIGKMKKIALTEWYLGSR